MNWSALLFLALVSCGQTAALMTGDAGGSDASVRVPKNHRASAGAPCPTTRPPGSTCTEPLNAGANTCASDSDCTAGTNGRCNSPNGPSPICPPNSCTYDECVLDSDCPAKTPCACRSVVGANTCITLGNCAVDSDCGPNGYCSPGVLEQFCTVPVYFCHTASDTCTDDEDCPQKSGGDLRCSYDAQSGHFACGNGCEVPP